MKYNQICPTIQNWDLTGKNVLLRIDGNIPVENNTIINDFRLRAALPTLHFLKKQKAHIIIVTHRGRPQGNEKKFSNTILVDWFERQGFSTFFYSQGLPSYESVTGKTDIFLLENIRFFKEEKNNDISFAHALASCADFYINDAWGLMHRSDTSITLVAHLFAKNKRSIGLLVEKELKGLFPLLTSKTPFTILGGSKVSDKLAAIKSFIKRGNAQTIALCPLVVAAFLPEVITSFKIDHELYEQAYILRKEALAKGINFLFPLDYVTKRQNNLITYMVEKLPLGVDLISVGLKTVDFYSNSFKNSNTIFYAGLMGFLDKPETLESVRNLFTHIGNTDAYRVIAGGSSVAACQPQWNDCFDFLSSGGGATCAYVSEMDMPALDIFL